MVAQQLLLALLDWLLGRGELLEVDEVDAKARATKTAGASRMILPVPYGHQQRKPAATDAASTLGGADEHEEEDHEQDHMSTSSASTEEENGTSRRVRPRLYRSDSSSSDDEDSLREPRARQGQGLGVELVRVRDVWELAKAAITGASRGMPYQRGLWR